MSSLTRREKAFLENLFGMESGYVLGFSDRTFGVFFDEFDIDIHDIKHQKYGTSKANKLRFFWDTYEDSIVKDVLSALIEEAKYIFEKNYKEDIPSIFPEEECFEIIERLSVRQHHIS
jgi:hypothetical protein